MTKSPTLQEKLLAMQSDPPRSWSVTGSNARPHLHGLLRYPAMMVPCMQGDIIDVLLSDTNTQCHVLDPFVGSGTILTESLRRDLNFTGIDINPLAALICEAKAAIDGGADIEGPTKPLLSQNLDDADKSISVEFPGRDKWFDDNSAIFLSSLRKSIMQIDSIAARKFLWTVFAETIRQCSNSRPSTYKLHIRKPENRIHAHTIPELFKNNLRRALACVLDYRSLLAPESRRQPSAAVFCGDVRELNLSLPSTDHQILVTSPPYGDNQTTIPYGQFSYLSMQWIPNSDLPSPTASQLMANTNTLDSVSLGGSVRGAEEKEDAIRGKSSNFDQFVEKADEHGKKHKIRKVTSFLSDFSEALAHLHTTISGSAHWVFTTGNRTVAGLTVPFDAICRDLLLGLAGTPVATLHRRLPNKRMPTRNSQGAMITAETTMIFEFA